MTTCHDQIKAKQPVAKFEQQTWYLVHYKPEFFLVNNSSHIVSECPRASGNGSLLGHIQLARRTIKRKSHFDQTFSKKKKRASLCLSARRNTLHGLGTSVMCGFYSCVSNNEMLWQIFSSKLEVINRSKILLGTAQKMIEKANHFGWNRSKTRKFRTDRKNGQASTIKYSGPVTGWGRA